MTSRTFTVFQDIPAEEVIKAKQATSNGMVTRSSFSSDSKLSSSLTSNEITPTDKENVNPFTGERAGTAAMSKKRKTTVLADKSSAHLALKTAKTAKDAQLSKKRKAGLKGKQSKEAVSKEGKAVGSTRKTTRRGTQKVSKLPRLEEEIIGQAQEIEHFTQASIDSRCYDLMVQPLADVSQAYEAIESAVDILASPVSKANFRKDASVEPDIRDFFPQTLTSLSSTSIAASEPSEKRKFTTPERKQIYAAFTFSSPSPSSERFKSLSRSNSVPRLELA